MLKGFGRKALSLILALVMSALLPVGAFASTEITVNAQTFTNKDGTTAGGSTPPATNTVNYQTIAAGAWHNLVIKTDGSLWAWGENYSGHLGDGTKKDKIDPTKIMDSVITLAAGSNHSFAVTADGSLWAWGSNNHGQLGDGASEKHTPVKFMDGTASVTSGEGHSLALKTDGSLWAWGWNNMGQLGDGTNTDKKMPVKIMDGVISVSAGSSHTLAIKADGSLWAWGKNDVGRLGDGTNTDRNAPVKIMDGVISVVAGNSHSLAIKADGSLWAWGYNYLERLGDGTETNRNAPVKIMDGVISAAAGTGHSFAIKTDGSLWAWGDNTLGQLGNGTTTNTNTPIEIMGGVASTAAGAGHSLAIKTDGSLWIWGSNEQLSNGIVYGYTPNKLMDGVKLPSVPAITPTTPTPPATPEVPAQTPPTTAVTEYNELVKNGQSVYKNELALEGIINAITAYGDFWWATAKIDGKVYDENYLKERGYYDVVCMNDGKIVSTTEYGAPSALEDKTNAFFAVKDITVDGQAKKLINISIAGTQNKLEWITKDFSVISYNGLHSGFYSNAKILENAENKVWFPTLRVALDTIINDIKSGSDKYLIFVNGHSLGAAVANIYTHWLYGRGVPNTALVGYTFATPLPVTEFDESNTPVFNILNDDDPITELGAGAITGSRFGIDRRYTPTQDFREKYYGDFVAQILKPVAGLPEQYIRVRHEQRTYLIIVQQGLVGGETPDVTFSNMIVSPDSMP